MRRLGGIALWGFLTLLLLGLIGGGGGFLWLRQYLEAPGPLPVERVVYLPRGTSLSAIADKLADAEVIAHPTAFMIGARISGRDRRLLAGEYRFDPRMSPNAVLALLESGRTVLHRITIPEGLTVHEVYAILSASDVLSGDLPGKPEEGSLLPETYLVPRDEPRTRLVGKMRDAMRQALKEAWDGRVPDLPIESPDEALVLASIIEKETSIPEEYPIVSAVFINRLKKGMRLQTDPTVIYALADGKGPLPRALTRADLEMEHPYNTYTIDGLPPGPISNPGRAAIEAALDPADVDYLYFVADGSGGHAFARTLDEHNRNVRRWRKLQKDGG